MIGRVMEAGYAYSESAVLLCNSWDLVVSEGSGDALVIGSWVLMTDHLRATLMRQAPPDGLNPLIAFFLTNNYVQCALMVEYESSHGILCQIKTFGVLTSGANFYLKKNFFFWSLALLLICWSDILVQDILVQLMDILRKLTKVFIRLPIK